MEVHLQDIDRPLEKLWAQKYVVDLANYAWEAPSFSGPAGEPVTERMLSRLRFASSQAWARTEALLLKELQRHRIATHLIDPWQIAADSRFLFEQAIESYVKQLTPERFSRVVASECGRIRRAYTAEDPRILGFMSMQFHYTGQLLLEHLPLTEPVLLSDYFKVMDDHLYMPLHRAYEAAAAAHRENSAALIAVQQLLPLSTQIAESVCAEVAQRNSGHQCHSGSLNQLSVRVSSIRDVEMFQIYLCLCALEGNITAVQQELFPLCVMLYPPLKVNWSLVRQMVEWLDWNLQKHLQPEDCAVFQPYVRSLRNMFSPDVLPDPQPMQCHTPVPSPAVVRSRSPEVVPAPLTSGS